MIQSIMPSKKFHKNVIIFSLFRSSVFKSLIEAENDALHPV